MDLLILLLSFCLTLEYIELSQFGSIPIYIGFKTIYLRLDVLNLVIMFISKFLTLVIGLLLMFIQFPIDNLIIYLTVNLVLIHFQIWNQLLAVNQMI